MSGILPLHTQDQPIPGAYTNGEARRVHEHDSHDELEKGEASLKIRAVPGPTRTQYDAAVKNAHRYREAMEAMRRGQVAWKEQQFAALREQYNMALQIELNRLQEGQSKAQEDNVETEMQMAEQILDFERQVGTLTEATQRLEQEKAILRRGFEKDMGEKTNEIMSLRQRQHPAPFATASAPKPATPAPQGRLPQTPSPMLGVTMPTLCTAKNLHAADRVVKNQRSEIPSVALRPAPSSATTPVPVPAEAGSTVPDSILTFDSQDPGSVEAVTSVVGEVLRRLGHDGVTLTGTRGKTKAISSKRSMQQAIKAQQQLLTPEQDQLCKQAIRTVWKSLFKTTEANDFSSYVPAPEEEVQACNRGVRNGPGENLQLYFGSGYSKCRWNNLVLRKICDIVLASREKDGGWGVPSVSEAYIVGELQGQLKRSQEAWALVQPRFINEAAAMETPEQVVARVEGYSQKRMADVSSRSLRQRKFERRVKIVDSVINIKASHQAYDLPTWDYFRRLLKALSVGGMSSEENGTEKIGDHTIAVFRVKLCIWRAEEITDYLRIIDRSGDVLGRTRGAKAAPRVKSMKESRSAAPTGLPRKMYNPGWLEKQERERPFYVQDELRISEEVFELLQVVTADL